MTHLIYSRPLTTRRCNPLHHCCRAGVEADLEEAQGGIFEKTTVPPIRVKYAPPPGHARRCRSPCPGSYPMNSRARSPWCCICGRTLAVEISRGATRAAKLRAGRTAPRR